MEDSVKGGKADPGSERQKLVSIGECPKALSPSGFPNRWLLQCFRPLVRDSPRDLDRGVWFSATFA